MKKTEESQPPKKHKPQRILQDATLLSMYIALLAWTYHTLEKFPEQSVAELLDLNKSGPHFAIASQSAVFDLILVEARGRFWVLEDLLGDLWRYEISNYPEAQFDPPRIGQLVRIQPSQDGTATYLGKSQ